MPCAIGTGRDASGACVPLAGAEAEAPGPDEDTAPPLDSGEPATDTDSGAPAYQVPEPTWSAEEVQIELDALLGLGVPDAGTIFAAWRSMFAGADPGCPGGDGYDVTSTASGCVSETGWLYAGQATYSEFLTEAGRSTVLGSDAYIISPDSGTMIGGGTVGLSLISEGGEDGWWMEMLGSFGLDSSPSPWLSQTPSLAMYFTGHVESGATSLTMLGGWSLGGRAVYLDVDLDSGCAGLSGTVQLWDPSGPWHVLALDCGSCGQLTYAGELEAAEICLDLGPFDAHLDRMEAQL